jgi:hypothetical protein
MTRNAAKEQPAQTEPAVELTSDIGRDAVLDPKVIAANAAFDRIRTHRLLFRDDWLPFVVGVHHLSLAAWEATGRRTRLNGSTPDWDRDDEQADNVRRIDEQIATIRELEARATTDAERIRELEVENERLRVRVAELERELAQHRVVEAVS